MNRTDIGLNLPGLFKKCPPSHRTGRKYTIKKGLQPQMAVNPLLSW